MGLSETGEQPRAAKEEEEEEETRKKTRLCAQTGGKKGVRGERERKAECLLFHD